MEKKEKYIKVGFIIIFFILILIPNIYFLLDQYKEVPNSKKLKSNSDKFTKIVQDYNQKGSLKKELIAMNSILKYTIFKSASKNEQVVIGEDNWLFYNSKVDFAWETFSNSNLLNKLELDSVYWLHEMRRKELEKKGVQYLISIWPDKNQICFSLLPKKMKIQVQGSISKCDQIIKHFSKNNNSWNIFSAKKSIKTHQKMNLFYKLDTHWNERGAYYGYEAFMKHYFHVFEEMPNKIESFDIINETKNKGDLIRLLGLDSIINVSEIVPRFYYQGKKMYSNIDHFQNYNSKKKLKVLFFTCSFGGNLKQFLSTHFAESHFLFQDYNPQIVNQLKPDVVVVCKTERYF
jgi:hypothetical protein